MPIFFFHIRAGSSLAEDPEGIDLPNLELAYTEAVAMARELAADDLRVNKPARKLNIEISNGTGQILTTLSVGAAINNTVLHLEKEIIYDATSAKLPSVSEKIQKIWDEIQIIHSHNQALAQESMALIRSNRKVYSETHKLMHDIMLNIASTRRNLQGP